MEDLLKEEKTDDEEWDLEDNLKGEKMEEE